MKNYVNQKNNSYFEGWYFKQQSENEMFAVIFGMNRDSEGKEEAFIQLLTEEEAYCFQYPIDDFFVEEDYFYIRIGKNYVTEETLYLDVEKDGIKIRGCFRYGTFTKLKSPIMGPFSALPMMECKHGILSMRHAVQGSLCINGKRLTFEKGIGYAEKNWGGSFPEDYYWTQCNDIGENKIFIFSAVATIPYMGTKFTGTINLIGYQGKLYRIATYMGAKVLCKTSNMVLIKQQKYLLLIRFLSETGSVLKAPDGGSMNRKIKEQLKGSVEYTFIKDGEKVFQFVSEQASCESERITSKTPR